MKHININGRINRARLKYGMKTNVEKIKLMKFTRTDGNSANTKTGGQVVENVTKFKYLGALSIEGNQKQNGHGKECIQ